MKTLAARWAAVLVLGLCVGVGGCQGDKEERSRQAMQDLETSMGQLLQDGKRDAAVALLEKSLNNPNLGEWHQGIVRQIMGIYLESNDVSSACASYLNVVKRHSDLAAGAMGAVEEHLLRGERYDELIAWTQTLLPMGLPKPVHERLLEYRVESYRGKGDTKAMIGELTRIIDELPGDESLGMLRRVMQSMLIAAQYDLLKESIGLVRSKYPDQARWQELADIMNFHAALNQSRFEEAEGMLGNMMGRIDDGSVALALNRFVEKASATHLDMSERVCVKAMEGRTSTNVLFQTGARWWVLAARDKQDAAQTVERLSSLVSRGLDDSTLVSALGDVFYFVMEKGDKGIREKIIRICSDASGKVTVEHLKARLTDLILDGSFMTEDYERALGVLERGMGGSDEKSRGILILKIKAHIAVAKGEREKAIEFFRGFMEGMSVLAPYYTDPASGARVSRDQIMGLNASRIAGLWGELGQNDKSTAARQEAISFYKRALEEPGLSEQERNDIAKQLQLLAPGK